MQRAVKMTDYKQSLKEELLAQIVNNADSYVVISDASDKIVWGNQRFLKRTGYKLADLIGRPTRFIFSSRNSLKLEQSATYGYENHLEGRVLIDTNNENPFWVDLSVRPLYNRYGDLQHYITIARDIKLKKVSSHEVTVSHSTSSTHKSGPSDDTANTLLDIMINGGRDDADQKEEPRTVEINRDMERALNEMNVVADLDFEHLPFGQEQMSLSEVISDTVEAFKGQAYAAHTTMTISYDDTLSEKYSADASRLTHIMGNLLSNAVKFTNGGLIHTVVKNLYDFDKISLVQIEVHDTGSGMDAESQDALKSKLDGKAGTRGGLGLSVAKAMVDKLGGELWFDSEAGRGSTFYVNLCLAKSSLN